MHAHTHTFCSLFFIDNHLLFLHAIQINEFYVSSSFIATAAAPWKSTLLTVTRRWHVSKCLILLCERTLLTFPEYKKANEDNLQVGVAGQNFIKLKHLEFNFEQKTTGFHAQRHKRQNTMFMQNSAVAQGFQFFCQ